MKLYLAANPDGTEVCSNGKLFRFTEELQKLINRFGNGYRMYLERPNRWCDDYSEGYYSIPKFTGVVLPKGTIQKLTGVVIDWSCEPLIIEVDKSPGR